MVMGTSVIPRDALNVEHRGVCGDGDRLHGSTAVAILLFAVRPR